MGHVKFATAAFTALLTTGASAADMQERYPLEIPQFEEVSNGWYLRGDIGMSNQRLKRLESISLTPDVEFLDKGGFDSGTIFGGGVGYQWNQWLRLDVTGEYRGKTGFRALDRAPNPGSPTGLQSNEYTATKSEWVVMGNAYIDLGTWHNITPFIGAGIGYAYNRIDHFRDVAVPVSGVAYADSASKGNLAWAAHAGLSYKVNSNLSLELSYRYIHLGDAITGDVTTYTGVNNVNNPMTFKDITSHDVRLGVRWMLNDQPPPPSPIALPPLMRRG